MNDNLTELTPMGDEALEARIIAWVLGEASPFEAAELEALCEQYPEWRVFQRRMLAIHELLGEASAVSASEEWRLPQEKRQKLDMILGTTDVAVVTMPKKKRSYQKWISSLAAVLVLGLCMLFYQSIMGTVGSKHIVSMGVREENRITAYSTPMPEAKSAEIVDSTPLVAAAGGVQIAQEPMEQAPLLRDSKSARNHEIIDAIPQEAAATFATRAPSPVATPAPAAPASSSAPVIAGKMMSDDYADVRRKTVEEVDGASWQLTENKQAAAAKPTADVGGGSGGGVTQAELTEMQKPVADGKEENGSLAMRERLRRQAPLQSLDGANAAGSAPADALEESEKVDEVRPGLYKAEGNYNLGKYDEAAREYENVLRVDPYNKDARRGLEQVAGQKSDYYRAAYDQTRAELLMEVDKSWELATPGADNKPVDPLLNELTPAPAVEKATADRSKADPQGLQLKENADADEALSEKNQLAPLSKKKEAPLDLTEISAEQEPYSTFSLRVSDNAFRIAQAAMAQGQRPAAESVRVEEFYNAFDYGDPVPTAQEPVAAAIEQSAHPILPQRNLLRIGLRTAASGRSVGQPLHLTLLVDQSGSMSRGDRNGALLAAVKELSSLLQAQDHVSVIGFSRTPRLLAEKIPGDQPQRLLDLLARTPSDGGTNLEEALKLGEVVAKRNQGAGAQNRLLLLTDGAANLGNADPDRLAAWVKQLRQKDIAFDIAGIGTDGLNDPLLVEIARHGNGRYYVINDAVQAKQQFAAQLAGAFRPAAENVKVQVRFNPKRVGKYQLIGFEKDRLNTEDFRNDQVDAAEMAAAEAGQALYQVEMLPDGIGDVGEVSVRFRDVATQQMVERKWTMRYDATTPVFERALPTMQLAGMAMLTAQKLQGGALDPMIRFSEMPQAQQQIREEFSANPRVAELLEMIRQLND